METYSVYIHTNIANGKMYIGLTRQAPEARWGVGGKKLSRQMPAFLECYSKIWMGRLYT